MQIKNQEPENGEGDKNDVEVTWGRIRLAGKPLPENGGLGVELKMTG